MALKRELIQFSIINRTDCEITLPLFQQGVDSINATTRYSWDISGEDFSCGNASIVINNVVRTITFNPDVTGFIISLNALGFGFFCTQTSGGDTSLYVQDDTNVYGYLQICVLDCPPLRIEFTNIADAIALVGDVNDVDNWNTYFQLPTYGSPFTSVVVNTNEVSLYGGLLITLRTFLFSLSKASPGVDIVHVIDEANCVIAIEGNSFSNCTNLVEVDFPVCTTIGDAVVGLLDGAFEGCTSLATLNFPQLTSAGYGAFSGFVPLTTTDFGELVTAGRECFAATTSTSLSFPSLVTAGDFCFYDCANLTSISLPSLINVGGACFQQCLLLPSLTLPSATIIDLAAFLSCTSLTTISLPSATYIGENAMENCISLTTISIPSCTNLGGSVLDNDVFKDIIGNVITLTVPAALLTCNSGNPDGDIQELQANNTVTIISV
jgi:hypothetical protein